MKFRLDGRDAGRGMRAGVGPSSSLVVYVLAIVLVILVGDTDVNAVVFLILFFSREMTGLSSG